jgi:hypothetical protein
MTTRRTHIDDLPQQELDMPSAEAATVLGGFMPVLAEGTSTDYANDLTQDGGNTWGERDQSKDK